MSLNMVPEAQLPSSGDELEKIDFPASCSFQSICQKLDKHGAWQQLGTKGISFHKKVDFCLMEGEMLMLMSEVRSHFIGRWKTPWSCCHGGTGWATTSCKETCLQNPLRGLKKNTGGGSKKNIFKLSSWGCLCRSYIGILLWKNSIIDLEHCIVC